MIGIGSSLRTETFASLAASLQTKLKLCLIANVSVAIAGKAYARLPLASASEGRHYLFSRDRAASVEDAAWSNALLMHARNQDDFHPEGRLHVGTIAIPTALAVAEDLSLSGKEFLDSLVAGYTVGAAIAAPNATAATQRGFRATGVFGPFVSAGAAGRAYGLSAEQVDESLAIAASMAGGLGQCWIDGGDEWQLHAAESARSGIVAVRIARSGGRGARRAFDGKAGFLKAFAGVEPGAAPAWNVDASRALDEIVIKRYSVSGINQSLVQVAERMVQHHAIATDAIKAIDIGFNAVDYGYPGTANTTKFETFADRMMSAAFCAACVFARGSYDFNDMFSAATPHAAKLLSITKVAADPDVVPFGCRISIELEGGRIAADRLADPARELDIDLAAVDAWAIPLWRAGGRSEADYAAFKETAMSLETRRIADLIAACR